MPVAENFASGHHVKQLQPIRNDAAVGLLQLPLQVVDIDAARLPDQRSLKVVEQEVPGPLAQNDGLVRLAVREARIGAQEAAVEPVGEAELVELR